MARFNNVAEQLKKKECKFLIAVLAAAKSSKALHRPTADKPPTSALCCPPLLHHRHRHHRCAYAVSSMEAVRLSDD